MEGPSIKPDEGSMPEQFSIQLSSCISTLNEIGCISKLGNPDNLNKIIDQLPYGIRLKWCDSVDCIIEKEDREVTVKDIMDFVTIETRAATQLNCHQGHQPKKASKLMANNQNHQST